MVISLWIGGLLLITMLQDVPTIDVPARGTPKALPATAVHDISLPATCAAGRIFLRLFGDDAPTDVVGISPDGQVVVFSVTRIHDLSQPRGGHFFVAESGLYWVVTARTNMRSVTPSVANSGAKGPVSFFDYHKYIARFNLDGTYRGSVKLEIPFVAQQLGVFPTGDVLISGMTDDNRGARLALVKPNGQLNRLLTLQDDLAAPRENADRMARSSYEVTIKTSQIVADGPNLLLFRRDAGAGIFVVTPGGEISQLKLEGIKGKIFSLRSTSREWLAQISVQAGDGARPITHVYALNPNDGRVLRKYLFGGKPGWGLGCADGREFLLLDVDDNRNYRVSQFALE